MRSDDELVNDYLGGSTPAFEELYNRYARKLFSFLVVEVGRTWAEDLLQETFSRVLSSLPRYRPQGKFSAYLYRIARNLARDRQRITFRDVPLEQLEPGALSRSEIDLELERASVRSALKSLSFEQRQVVLLREYLGLSFKEIANLIGRPIGTVLSQMHRAMASLKQRLVLD
ncbi:MAG: sigma-70 family RNA polymerase sigma factor [Armatimonadetes bacterium]|nr:sigma-70 family RNA polymerase sigma factor [Armatimonadota bacterium]